MSGQAQRSSAIYSRGENIGLRPSEGCEVLMSLIGSFRRSRQCNIMSEIEG